jgi:hypothetical protein
MTEKNDIQNVPMVRRRRYLEVEFGKAIPDIPVKKNALRPKAARGKAVAEPRCLGQFRAAVLMEAWKAKQLPAPVKNEKKNIIGTLPEPVSYAITVSQTSPHRIAAIDLTSHQRPISPGHEKSAHSRANIRTSVVHNVSKWDTRSIHANVASGSLHSVSDALAGQPC